MAFLEPSEPHAAPIEEMSDVTPGIHARIPRDRASPSSGGEAPLDRFAISRGHQRQS
jgi:hypothetical protein